jgi:hypothetical protein
MSELFVCVDIDVVFVMILGDPNGLETKGRRAVVVYTKAKCQHALF